MSTVRYTPYSAYYNTPFNAADTALDVFSPRTVPAEADDQSFEITATYHHRPDLLAYDLYGDAGLWWVFALRNPNYIEDPVFDMRIGKSIYLPKKTSLMAVLK